MNRPFKIKMKNGNRLVTVRQQGPNEVIQPHTLEQVYGEWKPTRCIGDRVREHPGRRFVELIGLGA
ncbi:hypothetical protein [Thioalkalivibrio thiocyanodenitrificans]|uniref:hypothetical protein n=1 Tax=Thioalkalivibrio thiocyanodenitrificans TaxID=243063 RepID=UPI0012EA6C7F|nr:hypothetical protein [Thioalkalivibrio thiocyanodenitrificans]